jgi:hypothetical protein
MTFIKTFFFLFCFLFTTHAFAKSNEYYRAVLVNFLTECDSKCQKLVFEQEVQMAFFSLMEAILNQLRFELTEEKKKVWQKSNI